jgi:hypothetical protein
MIFEMVWLTICRTFCQMVERAGDDPESKAAIKKGDAETSPGKVCSVY